MEKGGLKKEMDGLVHSAPDCYGRSGSNPDISQKFKMGDISKGVANTLARHKNLQKNFNQKQIC
jgi:hypothetical protein